MKQWAEVCQRYFFDKETINGDSKVHIDYQTHHLELANITREIIQNLVEMVGKEMAQ